MLLSRKSGCKGTLFYWNKKKIPQKNTYFHIYYVLLSLQYGDKRTFHPHSDV